jgi:hypothetical protein
MHTLKRMPLLTALLIGTFLCSNVPAQDFGDITDEEWAKEPPRQYPEANAAILFDKGTLEVTTDGITLYRHVRIKVFNQAGADEAADVEVSCWDDDSFRGFKAHTVTPDGDEHDVGRRDVRTQESGSRRIKVFSLPSVEPGSILEYKYRIHHDRFGYLDPWYFQNDLYTFHSEINLKLDPGFTYTSVTNNCGSGASPVKDIHPRTNVTTYTWTQKELLPMRDEPYSGAWRNYVAALRCQLVSYKDRWNNIEFIKGWPDLGNRFTTAVIEPYIDERDDLEETLSAIKRDSLTETELLKEIYNYVAGNIKLRDDADHGYYIHDNLEELLKESYGTGSEKNMLLIELCKLAGMKAWPVLICSRESGLFNPEIYQLQQFDYLIAFIETTQGGIYLDAGISYCPFGVLPSNHNVDGGFMLDGENSQIVRVISSPPRTYRMDQTWVSLDSAGLARCSTTVMLSGYFGISYGRLYELSEDEDFFTERFLDKLGIEYSLVSTSFEEDEENQRCTATLLWESSDMVDILDNNLIFKQPAWYMGENPFTQSRRFFPIDFRYPFTYHSFVTVDAGPGYACAELPAPVETVIQGIGFAHQCRSAQRATVIEAKLDLSTPAFDPVQYHDVRGIFEDIERAYAEELVFTGAAQAAELAD